MFEIPSVVVSKNVSNQKHFINEQNLVRILVDRKPTFLYIEIYSFLDQKSIKEFNHLLIIV